MSKKKYDDLAEKIFAKRYEDNETLTTPVLAAEIGVSISTMNNILRRQGIELRPNASARNPVVTKEIKKQAANLCREGANIEEAAKQLGICKKTVSNALREENVWLPIGRPRLYEVNDFAFEEPTEECLYWVGFLFADGCCHYDKYGSPLLICGLAEKDQEHLEKLRSFLGSTHPIRRYVSKTSFGGPCVYLAIRSTQLCKTLAEVGMVKKRTRSPHPGLIASPYFWRGCVDGDGWLGSTKIDNIMYPYYGLSGQVPIMKAFQDFQRLNNINVLNYEPTTPKERVFRVETLGNNAEKIIRLLYTNAKVALNRKNWRAQEIIAGRITEFPRYEEIERLNDYQGYMIDDDEFLENISELEDL